jgi:glycosyltransferase involved in cell wall biosynthesis
VHLLAIQGNGLSKYTSFRRLQSLVRAERIDVLHTHNSGPFLDAFLAQSTQFRPLPVVHTDHNRIRWPDRADRMLLERLAAKRFGGVVAVSDDARDNLHNYEHIPLDLIEVIDNGIDVDRFAKPSRATAQWLAEADASHFTHRIGVVAMQRERKGLDHLLNAVPQILVKHPGAGVIIAGGGPLEQQLKDQAHALGISANVRFLGRRSDVPDVLWALDVFVMPSESEGLPISILEAMAARRCIVSTAVGAIPDVLEHGACGWLVPPHAPEAIAHAVNVLLSDAPARTRMGDAAWTRVSSGYSIRATVEKYERLYLNRLTRSGKGMGQP